MFGFIYREAASNSRLNDLAVAATGRAAPTASTRRIARKMQPELRGDALDLFLRPVGRHEDA